LGAGCARGAVLGVFFKNFFLTRLDEDGYKESGYVDIMEG
jgi:hypothetical protein